MNQERTLSSSTVTAVLNAPIDKINIADRLLNLPDRVHAVAPDEPQTF